MKTKKRTYGDQVYTNFPGLDVPEYGVYCESLKGISIDFLLVYEKETLPTGIFRQLYL